MRRGLVALLLLVVCAFAGACSGNPQAATRTPPPTSAPTLVLTATAVPTFAMGARIGGVNVGGMSLSQARKAVETTLHPLTSRTLEVYAGQERVMLRPNDINLELPLDTLLHEAEQQLATGDRVRVPLQVHYDKTAVRARVEKLVEQFNTLQPAQSAIIITSTEALSRSFLYQPAYRLDAEAALKQIDSRLQSLQGSHRITLTPEEQKPVSERDLALLEEQIVAMAQEWDGVVGYYLYDFASGQEIGLNQHSIFSGASVMKIPILLQTYITIPSFDPDEMGWIERMIVESDNKAANSLLARMVGGESTEDALAGVQKVNETLRDLDLPFTYQSLPYEAGDYLITLLGKNIYRGPTLDGPEPQTEADPYVRTTPLEMGRLLTMIVDCSRGKGLLLERYKDTLNTRRCGEMIALLKRNGDKSRIVAGLPPGTSVAHKSGWVEDMHADVGVVESPGGDFVLAIYVYRKITPGLNYLADEVAAPVIANFARLTYSFYNPQPQPPLTSGRDAGVP